MEKNSPEKITKQPVMPVKPSAANKERLIYLGPNIPGGVLHKFAVFKGGIPRHVDSLIVKCPVIEKMLVPTSGLSKAMQAIEQKGTPENIFYNQVVDFIQEGGFRNGI